MVNLTIKLGAGFFAIFIISLGFINKAYGQAEALQGTQTRSIHQGTPQVDRSSNNQSQGLTDPTLYDGTQLRTPLSDRIDLVRERQGGQQRLGIYPLGSPNTGEEIQIQYRLQEPQAQEIQR